MANPIDDLIDKNKTPKQLEHSQVKNEVDNALKVINNANKTVSDNKREAYTKVPTNSKMEELMSNNLLLESIKKHDPKIFFLIKFCIEKNIRTFASCQGHIEEGGHLGYIGFDDPKDSNVKNIINYISNSKMNDKVGFSNYGETSNLRCAVYWPAEETQQRVQEIIKNVNNKDISKTPEIISLMERFTQSCFKNNIQNDIVRQTTSPEKSNGDISLIMYGNTPKILSSDLVKIIETLKAEGFHMADDPICLYEFKWDENMGDKKVCDTLKKLINILEKNKKDAAR